MSSDIAFYRSLIFRRMPLMMTVFVLCSAIGFGLAMTLPAKYEASAQLLLESAQIPDQLTEGGGAAPGSEQLQIIERRVMTRANLIDMANKFDVFRGADRVSPDAIVAAMRNQIRIRSASGRDQATTMTISFSAENPRLAANVVNEVVTLVLQLDTQRRVGIAEQTLDFFEEEVRRLDQELAIRSAAIVSFKEQNQDALPENLEYRVDRLGRLQDQIIAATRDRAALTEQRNRLIALGTESLTASAPRLSPAQQALQNAQNELEQALTVYSETNPRIRVIRALIAQLESQVAAESGQESAETIESPAERLFDLQLEEIDQRFDFIDQQIARAEAEIETLSLAIEKTPENAIRLESLQRDYANTLDQYNKAVANQSAASSRERIETLSKGERITVIEQATAPSVPTSPNRRLIAGGGVALGTMLAVGVFVLLELLNRAVRRPVDLVRGLSIQPIATIPYLETATGKKRRRMTQLLLIGALAVGIPVALWAIHMFYMPIDLIIDKIFSRFGF